MQSNLDKILIRQIFLLFCDLIIGNNCYHFFRKIAIDTNLRIISLLFFHFFFLLLLLIFINFIKKKIFVFFYILFYFYKNKKFNVCNYFGTLTIQFSKIIKELFLVGN